MTRFDPLTHFLRVTVALLSVATLVIWGMVFVTFC